MMMEPYILGIHNEPLSTMLLTAGEVLHFDTFCFGLFIPGHSEKMHPDKGLPFDNQKTTYVFQTSLDMCIHVGILNGSMELVRDRSLCLYEFPKPEYKSQVDTNLYLPLRILDAVPDLSGWVRLTAEYTYDRSDFILETLADESTFTSYKYQSS
jgi:hypothetical protein